MKTRERLWIDTSFLYALFVAGDQSHAEAQQSFRSHVNDAAAFHTSNMVVAEFGNLIAHRFDHRTALRSLHAVVSSTLITRHYADSSVESAALGWWVRFADQQFTLVDCISFEYMRRLGLRRALTYDCDFTIAGYQVG